MTLLQEETKTVQNPSQFTQYYQALCLGQAIYLHKQNLSWVVVPFQENYGHASGGQMECRDIETKESSSDNHNRGRLSNETHTFQTRYLISVKNAGKSGYKTTHIWYSLRLAEKRRKISDQSQNPITVREKYISAMSFTRITCTLSKKIYIDETGRKLEDCFRKHLRSLERQRQV